MFKLAGAKCDKLIHGIKQRRFNTESLSTKDVETFTSGLGSTVWIPSRFDKIEPISHCRTMWMLTST